jgi:hypothetical protein
MSGAPFWREVGSVICISHLKCFSPVILLRAFASYVYFISDCLWSTFFRSKRHKPSHHVKVAVHGEGHIEYVNIGIFKGRQKWVYLISLMLYVINVCAFCYWLASISFNDINKIIQWLTQICISADIARLLFLLTCATMFWSAKYLLSERGQMNITTLTLKSTVPHKSYRSNPVFSMMARVKG